MGQIGLVVPSEKTLPAFMRILRYWQFLGERDKQASPTGNVLVVTEQQTAATLGL